MFTPYVNRTRSIQCPISGTKFWHNGNPKKRALALRAQQEFTADLIRELDNERDGDHSGIRRPIIEYAEQYYRRRGPEAAKSDVAVSVSAA
jgi:hypothetical protein